MKYISSPSNIQKMEPTEPSPLNLSFCTNFAKYRNYWMFRCTQVLFKNKNKKALSLILKEMEDNNQIEKRYSISPNYDSVYFESESDAFSFKLKI